MRVSSSGYYNGTKQNDAKS